VIDRLPTGPAAIAQQATGRRAGSIDPAAARNPGRTDRGRVA
jgi:hypothetical protein